MKRERIHVDNRRKKIMEILQTGPQVRVEDLANRLDVSLITIRRDLQFLEDKKQLKRVYGGAVASEEQEDEVQVYRKLIAQYAATLVEPNDNLFINTSRNALQVLEYIQSSNITVITNNGKAISCNYPHSVSVVLTGGELRHPKNAMVGEFALRNLQPIYAKKAFLGCSGICADKGVTTELFHEVSINELMFEHATQGVYVLADHTKIGKKSSFISSPIEKVKMLITDEKAPEEALELIREKGILVHQVKRGDF